MKRGVSGFGMLLVAAAALMLSVVAVGPAYCEEEGPTAEANIAFLSQYIWRGQAFSKDSLVIQPELTVSWYGFIFDIWANLDTNEIDGSTGGNTGKSNLNETDITFAYGRNFGPLYGEFGYIYYALDGSNDSQELYLSLGLDVLLSPTLTVYREIDAFPNWYILFGISHSFTLTDNIGLDLAATIAYLISDDGSYPEVDSRLNIKGKDYSGFLDAVFSVGLPITIGKYMTITPNVAVSFPVGDDADNLLSYINRDTVGKDESTWVYGGVTFTLSF